MKWFQLAVIYSIVFLLTCVNVVAQDSTQKKMVRIDKYIPGLVVDLVYASEKNFMKQRLYPANAKPWLRKVVADSLKKVQEELNKAGLGLKIFDAYRPWSVTGKMWEKVKDERYAADPKKGSNHNRGIAVDLTLIDLSTRIEWDMGTGFDNFSDSAHYSFKQNPDFNYRREYLRSVMEKHGFRALETEWWHFSLGNAAGFEVLDLTFSELNKMK